MKKIIYVIIISLILGFTFSITSKATYQKVYSYDEVDFIYNTNFLITNYEQITNYVILSFYLDSLTFEDNIYLQDSHSIANNTFFYMDNYNWGGDDAYVTNLQNPAWFPVGTYGSRIYAQVSIPKEYFTYYYEDIAQVDELYFFTRFVQDYASEVSENFRLYVKVENKYQSGYDTGYEQGISDSVEMIEDLLEDEYRNGYTEGYENGLLATQEEAYNKGYEDGANKSFMGTMDKWLVPAIIIIMLLGGYFAIARKKRDGDI